MDTKVLKFESDSEESAVLGWKKPAMKTSQVETGMATHVWLIEAMYSIVHICMVYLQPTSTNSNIPESKVNRRQQPKYVNRLIIMHKFACIWSRQF